MNTRKRAPSWADIDRLRARLAAARGERPAYARASAGFTNATTGASAPLRRRKT